VSKLGAFDSYVQDEREKAIRHEAERRVLAVRGSYDVPGFEACVDAEMVNIVEEQSSKDS
jgi:hypothetical protein